MKFRDRENVFVLGGFLGVTAVAAALMLALVSQWTGGQIRKSQEDNRSKVFHRLLLPEFDSTGREVVVNDISFTPVLEEGNTVGFVGHGCSGGYGGEIEVMVGFDLSGRITGVQILRHKETPGLGAKVCDRKFQRTILNFSETAPEVPANDLLDQFNGRSAQDSGNWCISKDGGDFIYQTGATVTSRAVTAAVNDIARAFIRYNFAGGR